MNIRYVVLGALALVFSFLCVGVGFWVGKLPAPAAWPKHYPTAEQMYLGTVAAAKYKEGALRPSVTAKSYRAAGPYYGYGTTRYYQKDTDRVRLDKDGIPQVKYPAGYFYNPTTIAQQALAEYSRETGPTPKFMKAVDKMLTLQDERGAFTYDFPFRKYVSGEDYAPGWSSGMAQGQALSALGRAYHLTKDRRYLDAGNAALDFMMTPAEAGGPLTSMAHLHPTLKSFPFIMEYPQDPPVYTLNGFMFAVQGLYDWYVLTGSKEAKLLFDATLQTLIRVLPYHDLGTFSAYDLAFMTVPKNIDGSKRQPHINTGYHAVHIEQLWALYFLTKQPALMATAERWQLYVN